MDKLKIARALIRGIINKTINKREAELTGAKKDIINLKARFERLNDLQISLQDVDQLIFNEMKTG